MTNYIHMFGCGHAMWYAKRHRNFYRYSNQSWVRIIKGALVFLFLKCSGCNTCYSLVSNRYVLTCILSQEAMIKRIKCIYYSKTQRGGMGAAGSDRSHVWPIMRVVQRWIMWKSGLGREFFKGLGK